MRASLSPSGPGPVPCPQRAMGPDRIEFPSPTLDQDLDLRQRVEDLAIEQLIAQLAVEGLDITVLPWASRFYIVVPEDPVPPVYFVLLADKALTALPLSTLFNPLAADLPLRKTVKCACFASFFP